MNSVESGSRALQMAMHELILWLTGMAMLARFMLIPIFLAGAVGAVTASTRALAGGFLVFAAVALLSLVIDAWWTLISLLTKTLLAGILEPLREVLEEPAPAPVCVRDDIDVRRAKRRLIWMAGLTVIGVPVGYAFRSTAGDYLALAGAAMIVGTAACVWSWVVLLARRSVEDEMRAWLDPDARGSDEGER